MTEDFKARPYQVQLEEIASKKNTIIHLPTGSGKTFIGICLIKRFREALQLPWGNGGKRTFFLVNTVPLVNQQRKVIEQICPVSGVGAYSGEDGVDYWNKIKWDHELAKHQVIVMTSQILLDMIAHAYIRVADINLIIFDECHHAVDDHPMRSIMKYFESCPVEEQPRVLGLTATLLNSNVTIGQVEKSLKDLETTFHATIATVNELGEVLNYSTNPHEQVLYYQSAIPSADSRQAIEILNKLQALVISIRLPKVKSDHEMKLKSFQRDISIDPKKIVKAVKNMLVSMVTLIEEMGAYGGALSILAYIILLERLKRKSSTIEEERLYMLTRTYITQAHRILLNSMQGESGYRQIIKHSSSKIIYLLNILKEYNPAVYEKPGELLEVNLAKKPLSAIIFTQQRFTAKVLYNLLKDVKERNPEEFGFLKHDFLVGFNLNPMKCTREQHYMRKASQKALLMFGKNELNCIISTSVIEEGVDIPQCLLVLRYDPPMEYRSYIQSKGRARSHEASYVMLVKRENKTKFEKNFRDFQRTEQYIQRILVGSTDDRDAPTLEDIQDNLYDDVIPPYIHPEGRLTAVLAIGLLNRYCSLLPHDKFTVITPAWIQEKIVDEKGGDLNKIIIIMPLACPIKEPIEGDEFPDTKTAKRSAALETCKKLHQLGELDAKTMLPVKYASVDFDSTDVRQCLPNWPWVSRADERHSPKPGSKKYVRTHKIMFPKFFNAIPGSSKYYLHIIKMKSAFPVPTETRDRALYNFLQSQDGYGFLTQHPLPDICAFPSFMVVGEVTTEVVMNFAVIDLNGQLFDLVKRFHFFIFDQVLSIAKKFIIFEGVVNCMYLVPVVYDDGYDIDWGTMQQHEEVPPAEMPPAHERRSLHVTKESYQNSVVTPWYRGSILPDRYIVSDVLEYKTPRSQFDSESYLTYADYFSTKYNLEILGSQDQPLLEVRNISSRMNCLLPRAVTIRTFTDKQKKLISAELGDDKLRAYTEVFVPEFCLKFEFPGELWYKAMMLPSIFHRIHMLIVAQELILEISESIGYGTVILPNSKKWLPIEVDITVAEKALLSNIEMPENKSASLNVDRINHQSTSDGGEASVPRLYSMKENLYQLQKKKINKEYPWEEHQEPIDIERNLTTVTVMDIECYDEFVSAVMAPKANTGSYSPKHFVTTNAAAIKPSPPKYNAKIGLLENKLSGPGPELRDVVAALTTINSHDTFCLERAETLGDSFLKFAATLYLYHKFPGRNEGQLTNIKSRMISNRNLYYAGERINLGGRMKVDQFSPRKDFLVPGFFAPKEVEDFIRQKEIRPTYLIGTQFSREEALHGELYPESWETICSRYADGDGSAEPEPQGQAQNSMQGYLHSQAVSDKSVADCVEAIIGTYLLSGGVMAAVKVVEWLRIIPEQGNLAYLLRKPVSTVISEGKATAQDVYHILGGYQPDIEKIMNYKFRDSSFLLQAMSHASYIRNRLTGSYERLEFLGDAILDFLITSHIYENNPSLSPGDLTDLRSALVNNVTFAAYVVKLGLHKYICKELNPSLDRAITEFVEHQAQRDHEIVEDVLYLIDEDECQIAEYVDVPKTLSDIFEALIGAIYLDSGGSLETVWGVVYPLMYAEIDAFSRRIPRQPVQVLHEMIHACPVFGPAHVVDPDVPKVMVQVNFTKNDGPCVVFGVGRNKYQAKRAAAKLALKVLANT